MMDTGQVVLQDPPKRAPPLGSPTHTAVAMTHISSINGIPPPPTHPHNSDITTDSTMFPVTAVIPAKPKRAVTINNNTVIDKSLHQQVGQSSPQTQGKDSAPCRLENPSVPSTLKSHGQPITTNGNVQHEHPKRSLVSSASDSAVLGSSLSIGVQVGSFYAALAMMDTEQVSASSSVSPQVVDIL